MKPLEPNTVIQDRYLIKELIGKGGMGQVYLAVDNRLGNSVALKRTTVGDDPALAEAFENEAKTLAQLRHPYLPKVSDHFVEGDEQFLVMEFIAGDDLSQRLKALNRPFPLNWVLFWADELLEALTYLHTNDPPIIHRDIKPQNLKLTGDNHIVLLDFGLSKHSVSQTKITTSGSVVGYTPHYAPMEQIRGTGTSALSDIYALSATLYHLLSNRVPPDALTRADTILSEKPDPLRPLTELNGEVTEVIADAIMKGMELNQDKRFPSAREMQKTLRKAYNELQKSMSAETVAFNVADLEPGAPPADDEKTEVISGGLPDVPPEPSAPAPDSDKTEVIGAEEMREIAAVHVSEPPPASESFGDKTEVITDAGPPVTEDKDTMDLPSPAPGITEVESGGEVRAAAEEFVTKEDYSAEDFRTSEDIEATGVPELGETVAVGGFADDGIGSEPAATGIVEELPDEEDFEDQTEPEDEEPGAVQSSPVISAGEEEKEKSTVGKYIAILLGLGAVLILIAGTVGVVGWYLLRDDGQPEEPTPAPTPEASASEEFTPEPTPSEEPSATPEESPEESPTPSAEPTRSPVSATPTPRRTPTRTPTRTPASTPRRTPTPQPTVRKTPRTLPTILQ